ncbi:hypothetical protein GALMADRAFT_162512 [Galerina marginata CBS 339.88]|uniref:DNA topoisomerase (ATP-hydrolyzing) n=1 Tax=Galerina marginata (strain CBS 339.88) TaxID=685588 RepID=A0A067S4X1_GALM3|nr:hypothetical protein GALMADRAFT_162512 [Galerina marginata CBS 339.88]
MPDGKRWLSKYFKGLGTGEDADTREYFNHMAKNGFELILFSMADNTRWIPSVADGLKAEAKFFQLCGFIAEKSAYHHLHGEVSLGATINNLAQEFVGSNNLNLLRPKGQFGTHGPCRGQVYLHQTDAPRESDVQPFRRPSPKPAEGRQSLIKPNFYMPIVPLASSTVGVLSFLATIRQMLSPIFGG